MLRQYEEKAMEIIENSKGQKPKSAQDMQMLASAMIIVAGAEIMQRFMGGGFDRFDHMRQDYFRQGVKGSGGGRRYDGQDMQYGQDWNRGYMDGQWMDTQYREGGGQGGGGSRGGSSGGGQSGGGQGGSRSGFGGF